MHAHTWKRSKMIKPPKVTKEASTHTQTLTHSLLFNRYFAPSLSHSFTPTVVSSKRSTLTVCILHLYDYYYEVLCIIFIIQYNTIWNNAIRCTEALAGNLLTNWQLLSVSSRRIGSAAAHQRRNWIEMSALRSWVHTMRPNIGLTWVMCLYGGIVCCGFYEKVAWCCECNGINCKLWYEC